MRDRLEIVKVLGTEVAHIPTQLRQDDGLSGDVDLIAAYTPEIAKREL